MIKFSLYLFAFSFATLSFTSLRFLNVFGVSELAVVFSFLFLLFSKGTSFKLSAGHKILDAFWLVFIVLLISTLLFAQLAGMTDIGKSYHDFFSFMFCFLVAVIFFNLFKHFGLDELLKILVRFSVISSIFLIFLLPALNGEFSSLFNNRYYGLSHNPNQLALCSLFSLYVSIYVYISSSNKLEKLLSSLNSVFSIILGFLSISDAFLLSFFAFISLCVLYEIFLKLFKPSKILKKSASLICLVSILSGISFAFNHVMGGLTSMSEESEQGEVRFTLWKHGFDAMLESPVFGLGPGAWSGLDYPIQGHEAHNSYIDFGNSFGFFGLFMFFIVIFVSVFYLKKSKFYYLIFSLFSLLIFGAFHYIFRFPFTWIILSIPFLIRAR